MISPNVPSDTTVSAILPHHRGFLPEETVMAGMPGHGLMTYYRPFWRPVLAGAIFALSVFVLSWYLMLGLHIGIDSDGVIDLGFGAAIWLCLTSIVAFFLGGFMASAMTSPGGSMKSSWLKGAAVWGVSIPLSTVVYSYVGQNIAMVASLYLPRAAALEIVNGTQTIVATRIEFAWAIFICMAVGLVASLIGSASGSVCSCSKANGSL
jgi:hypothetical protein